MELSKLEVREIVRLINEYESDATLSFQQAAFDDELRQKLIAFAFPGQQRQPMHQPTQIFIPQPLPGKTMAETADVARSIINSEFTPAVAQDNASGQPIVATSAVPTPASLAEQADIYRQVLISKGMDKDVAAVKAAELLEALQRDAEVGRISFETQEKMKNRKPIVGEKNADNPHADFAPPDKPPAPPKERPPLGKTNRYGHPVVSFQGDEPVFDCGKGHGYVYNPTVPGCSFCFLNGVQSESVATRQDEGAIDGEDSNW